MAENVKQTIIENGTEFDGSIKSECPITLSGTLKGQVTAPSLSVTPSGAVKGKVKVAQLTSRGEVSGEVEADSVELSGRVSDETVIRARSLEVKLAQPSGGLQVSFGNCQLEVGDLPARPKAESTAKTSNEASASGTSGKGKQNQAPSSTASEDNLADAVADLMK
jgi:hypothetical protein